ncbi:MAG: SMC-Scp complex subunit ScpB [candidate division WOR-3 bacterium]|jgi:segregation and condensation protein B
MSENQDNRSDDLLEDKGDPGVDAARPIIEALVIATTEPLPLRNIAEIAGVSESMVKAIIDELNLEYRQNARAFEIKEIAGGFQIYTLPKFAEWVGALHKRKDRLSKAALETLAIIAYHQPVIRADIEKMRGVDSTWILDSLLQKNLIKTCGRLPSPGRPIKYGTTKEFLRYFGIRDIGELPKEEDFGEAVMSGYPELPRLAPKETGEEIDSSIDKDDAASEDHDELDDVIELDEDRGQHATSSSIEDENVPDEDKDLDQ